jgi:site-specific DNA-methyltransferase (adenine-specific)
MGLMLNYLSPNNVYHGLSENLMQFIEPNSIALSFWSPPYFVGKEYEKGETYESWQKLLKEVIARHGDVIKPGGFMVVNIADILAFKDEKMPRIQAMNPANQKCAVTKQMVLDAKGKYPNYNRYQLAKLLGCSEQTIDRRLRGVNIRGGKHNVQTRVKLVGGNIEQYAMESGLYLYDKRVWKKDPAWENSKWTTNTYKAVSETEDLYIFWKPGEYIVDRNKLTSEEWKKWGYRQVWEIPSVRKNDDHEAKFPLELATRVIRLFSNPRDIVLDPFIGSGTTAVAAILNDRQFIGIDKEIKSFELSTKNIKNAYKKKKMKVINLLSFGHATDLSSLKDRSLSAPSSF